MDHWLHAASWLGNSAHAWIVAGIGALIGYIVIPFAMPATRLVGALHGSADPRAPPPVGAAG